MDVTKERKFKVKMPIKEEFSPEKLKCPYCGYEDPDSWELENESDEHICPNCEKEFSYDSHLTRYFTSYSKEYKKI